MKQLQQLEGDIETVAAAALTRNVSESFDDSQMIESTRGMTAISMVSITKQSTTYSHNSVPTISANEAHTQWIIDAE